jgi:tRNA nucleotidyltransferase/poly(A) polymerase
LRTHEGAFHRKKKAVGASLRRRRPLAALGRLARARGIDAWIVGGAPRDGLLGRPALDVDVAVSRDAESLSKALEALGLGRAVEISEATPRVFRVAGRLPVDLAEVEGGTIEADLARRDFTANAIAIDLADGRWIDPFRGAGDLAGRRLRLVRESNLAEDPLRAFRAARLYATHGLRPDADTRRACARIAPRLVEVAAERVQTELAKMLEARSCAAAFRWAAQAGLLAPALAIAAAPARWKAAAGILARLDASSFRHSPARRRLLRLAGIAAGLRLSAKDASDWLGRRRHGRRDAGETGRLLELVHAAFLASTPDERWALLQDAGTDLKRVLDLACAIRPAFLARARSLRLLSSRRRRGPRVSGSDLMQWLSEPSGPRIGRLLREIEIEGLRGRVRSRKEARAWAMARREPRRAPANSNPKFIRPNPSGA